MAFLPRPSSIGKFANSLPYYYRCYRPVRSLGCNPFFKKFPAPLRREFCCKPLNSLADWARKSAQEARILQNSLFFSLLAGNFEVETGSIRAASTATQWVSMHPFCLGLATTSARAALRLKAGRQPLCQRPSHAPHFWRAIFHSNVSRLRQSCLGRRPAP